MSDAIRQESPLVCFDLAAAVCSRALLEPRDDDTVEPLAVGHRARMNLAGFSA